MQNGAIQSLKQAKDMTRATRTEVTLMISSLSQLTSYLNKTTDQSDKYTSSLRLLKTTLKETTNEAISYVDTLTEMVGLDEPRLTKQMGLFSQIGESLNMSHHYSELFAEDLTKLTTKLALLYNIDFSVMASNVQKAIQGTQTTLKAATGIEASAMNEQALLVENGINRQVNSLNEAELAIVRYGAILRQVTNDTSVYQDAVNSLAWQKQILSSQVKRLATAIGQLLTPVFTKLYTVANAVLMVIVEIIQWIGKLVGISIDTTKTTSEAADGYNKLGAGIKSAADNAKKSLRSFDKLNNITTPSSSGADASAGLGVDPKILGLLDETQNKLDGIKTKASEIRDIILKWLGFTKDENGELKFTGITFGTILTTALLIAPVIFKILKTFKLIKGLNIFSNLAKSSAFGGILSSVGQIGEGIALWAGGAGTFLEVLKQFILPAIVNIVSKIAGVAAAAWGIIEIIKSISDINANGWNFDNIINLIKGIALVIGGIALVFGAWIPAAIAAFVVIGTYIAKWIKKHWEEIKEFFTNIWNKMVEIFSPIGQWIWDYVIQPIIGFFKPIIDAIVDIVQTIWKNLSEIVVGVAKAVWSIITKVGEILAKIVEIFITIGKIFYTYVVKPIWDNFLAPLFSWIYDKVISPLINVFRNVGSWVYNNIIKPIWDRFIWLKDKIVEIFRNIITFAIDFAGNILISVINSVLSAIEKVINKFIRMLNKAVDILNKVPRS